MTIEVVHFPADIYPSTQRLTPSVGAGQSMDESPFSGAQTVTTYRGAERWLLDMSFEGLTGDDRADMMAFVARLRVSHNVFLCVQHTAPQRGAYGGTPRAVGSLGGQHLNIYGASNSVSSWARNGDFISVNSQLKMILGDYGTNGSGVASLFVWPPFYDSPSSGALIAVSSPCGAFRATRVIDLHTKPPRYITDLTISAVERVNSEMVSDFL